MLHTSGTTSNPKRVMLTHKNLICNIESNIASLEFNEKDTTLIVLPMYFGYCNCSQFLTHVYLGGRIIIAPQPFNPAIFLQLIEKYKCTNTTCIPSMLFLTISIRNKYDMSSLRYLCFGGGVMPVHKLKQIISFFEGTGIVQTYGQTEASPRVTCLLPKDCLRKIGSVGKPIPGVEIDILDKNGVPVKNGEKGEIVVRGNNVMKGSDKMYVMLACGQYCYYVTRNTKHKIREYYGLDNKELKNLLHTSDDSVEFYLQYLLCKELHDLDLDKKGYANLFITDANCMYMRNYEKKALIKQNIYQLDKFNDDYNFYGFVSQIEEKGNKKASIINYIISEEDLIKNHSFKIINFFHDLLDKQKLLMYNQIGVRGVLLNCENTDIKDAEIIFEMIEECQLDWVVIGGGEHISIGQRRYEKFVNKINNKSNWTPISL